MPPEPVKGPGTGLATRTGPQRHWRTRERWIATLDVQGNPEAGIAQAVGVSIQTVKRTKGKDGYDDLCREIMDAAVKDIVPLLKNTLIKLLDGASRGADKLVKQLELEEDGLPQHGIQQKAAIALQSNPVLIKMLSPYLGGDEEQGKGGGGATFNVTFQADGSIQVGEDLPEKGVTDGDWKALEIGEDGADRDTEDEYVAPPEPGDDVGF